MAPEGGSLRAQGCHMVVFYIAIPPPTTTTLARQATTPTKTKSALGPHRPPIVPTWPDADPDRAHFVRFWLQSIPDRVHGVFEPEN